MNSFEKLTDRALKCVTLIRFFYVVALYEAVNICFTLVEMSDLKSFAPLWPVGWISPDRFAFSFHVIAVALVAASILSMLFSHVRAFRIFTFVAYFEAVAAINSFGKINHPHHAILWCLLVFCFFPNWQCEKLKRVSSRLLAVSTFKAAQITFLLFYSLAGFWKVVCGVVQWWRGEVHAFHPDAFAYQITFDKFSLGHEHLLANFLINTPALAYPLYLGTLCIETFAIVAAFRPKLQRWWGASIILFHIGTRFTLSASFSQNILLAGILLVCSPFIEEEFSWRDLFKSFKKSPVKLSHPTVFFDGVCNLCDRTVQFLLRADKSKILRFASLQSDLGKKIMMAASGRQNLKTILFVDRDRIYERSSGVLRIARYLSWPYKIGFLFLIVPRFVRDTMYDFISRNRYRWFGKKDQCMIPSREDRERFLEL